MTCISECLEYKGGQLAWKERPAHHFKDASTHRAWNKKFSGKVAGGIFRKLGRPAYLQVRIDGRQRLAHRVVWELVVGEIPEGLLIDHINGNGMDNRIENLRLVNNSQNQRNTVLDRRNKSGIPGVDYMERINLWRAQAYDENGGRIYLGTHKTLLDAASARKSAEIKFGYHENHGRVQERLKQSRHGF